MPRRRSNPYTEPHPADWSSMTKLQRSAWNRSHWSKDGVSAPRPFAVRAAERSYREAMARKPKRGSGLTYKQADEIYDTIANIGEWDSPKAEKAEIRKMLRKWGFASEKAMMNAAQDRLSEDTRSNPKVAFRAKGKRVAFVAKRKKARGKVPKHLRPYLFKKGHKAKAKRTKRKGATRACRGRRKVRMTSRRCRRASR